MSNLWENHNLLAEAAFSRYQSNIASPYTSNGAAYRLLFKGTTGELHYELEGLSVSPRYDPFLLQYPALDPALFYQYWRFPDLSQQPNLYSLHSTRSFPHNRQGFRGRLDWQFSNGEVNLTGGVLSQQQTSAFDLRTPQPLGFSPGWFDAIFPAFGADTYRADGSLRENPRGKVSFAELHGRLENVDASVRWWNFWRPSALEAPLGSLNAVDLTITQTDVGYHFELQPDVDARLGLGYYTFAGHFDPTGFYSAFATASGRKDFNTLDTRQWIPSVGLKFTLDEYTHFDLTYRYFITTDHVAITGAANGGNLFNPLSWNGSQLISTLDVAF